MKRKILSILLAFFVISLPGCAAASTTSCSACNGTDLTTGAIDINMYSIYSYLHSKGIPVAGVKLSPNDLKENYLAQYVDGNDSYFIHPGSKSIKLDNRIIYVNPAKFTGYAIVSGDDAKKSITRH